MAEIRVEPQRRGRGWLWMLILGLIVVAALVWYFTSARAGSVTPVDTTGGATTTAPARTP